MALHKEKKLFSMSFDFSMLIFSSFGRCSPSAVFLLSIKSWVSEAEFTPRNVSDFSVDVADMSFDDSMIFSMVVYVSAE